MTSNVILMNTHKERGIALVLALFLMSAMSVLAASLMFLSQTETYASMNYRMMSQARYAGEAAVQKASDFLLSLRKEHAASLPVHVNWLLPAGDEASLRARHPRY